MNVALTPLDGLKLNLYGKTPKEGWQILAPEPGPHVDHVGVCTDLSRFDDSSVAQVYAWHVLNKLDGHQQADALREIYRVLQPGGYLIGAVTDMDLLCRIFVSTPDPVARMGIASVIFGDHSSPAHINHFGFNTEILIAIVQMYGFRNVYRTAELELFAEDRETIVEGIGVDLNFIVEK